MDYARLFGIADSARAGRKLSAEDSAFVARTVPEDLATFPDIKLPKSVAHPAGFSVSGAPVGTFLRSALLLSGKKVFGERYKGSRFYEGVERDMAMRVMRSHFNNGDPKGAFCCVQCTLAVFTVLEANAIRWFDCRALAPQVRQMIRNREWRFASPSHPKMVRWALRD